MPNPRTPKRVYFTKGFPLMGRQIVQWPSDRHRGVSCRVIGARLQLLDPVKAELFEVPTSEAVIVFDAAESEGPE